jgi:AcrR family transcriptional regulator
MSTTTTTSTRVSLRERNKQLTRDAILRSAMLLFERDGVGGTSMADVAELTGVSDTTVFNYFKTKDDLVDALVEAMSGPMTLEALVAARPTSESPIRALRNVLKQARQTASDDPVAKRQLFAAARSDKLLWGAYLRGNDAFARRLTETFQRREPSWPPVHAAAAAHSVLGAMEAVFEHQPADGSVDAWADDLDEVLARLERAWRR